MLLQLSVSCDITAIRNWHGKLSSCSETPETTLSNKTPGWQWFRAADELVGKRKMSGQSDMSLIQFLILEVLIHLMLFLQYSLICVGGLSHTRRQSECRLQYHRSSQQAVFPGRSPPAVLLADIYTF